MGNPVIHFEINSKIATQLHEFYSSIFGWEIDASNPIGYGIVDTKSGSGIRGGIGPAQDGPNFATFYIAAADTDAALKKVEALGGKTVMPTTELMGGEVTIALFSDPQGNVIGLVKDDQSSPAADYAATKGSSEASVEHVEVLGTDGAALQKFYADAFGWEFQDAGEGYGMFAPQDGYGVGGGVGPSQGGPSVQFYVTCSDIPAKLKQIADKGGKTVLEPMIAGGVVEIAAFHDPEGNLVGLARSLQ